MRSADYLKYATSLLLGISGVTSTALAAGNAEYLKAEQPQAKSLKDVRTSTEEIGVTSESWLAENDPFSLLPRNFLPALREKYVSKTGNPFIDDTKFSVRPRFYYLHRNRHSGGVQESAAYGGSIGMETGWLNDTVRFAFTGYTSQKIYGQEGRDGLGLLAPGQESYTVFGEAFMDLKKEETSFRIGRSRVNLPYINADDTRMVPNTFELIGMRTQDIEDFQFGIGHFNRMKTKTSADFESMSQAAGIESNKDRGVSVVSMRYNFAEDTFVALTEQYGWDMFNNVYVEGEHLIELSDKWSILLGAQFTDQRSVGDELTGDLEAQSAGAKVAMEYCNIIATASYTWTDGGDGMYKPWGGTPCYHSAIIQDFDRAGEDSFRIGLVYDFEPHGIEGLTINTEWYYGNTPDSGGDASPDQEEFDVTLDYKPNFESIDGFWLRLRYANSQVKGADDIEDIRAVINYSYSF